jgi:hypothetical protein
VYMRLVRKNGKQFVGQPSDLQGWFEKSNGDLEKIEEGDFLIRVIELPEAMRLFAGGETVYLDWCGSLREINQQTREPLQIDYLNRGIWFKAAA